MKKQVLFLKVSHVKFFISFATKNCIKFDKKKVALSLTINGYREGAVALDDFSSDAQPYFCYQLRYFLFMRSLLIGKSKPIYAGM